MAQSLLSKKISTNDILRKAILNHDIYQSLHNKTSPSSIHSLPNASTHILFLPQWENYKKNTIKKTIREQKAAKKQKALEHFAMLLEAADLHFKNLRTHNLKQDLEKKIKNQDLLTLFLFLKWYRLRKKYWLRIALLKLYRRFHYRFRRKLKKKHTLVKQEKISDSEHTHREIKQKSNLISAHYLEMLWLKNLHAKHYGKEQKITEKPISTLHKTLRKRNRIF